MSIRLVIADQHEVVLAGVAVMLQGTDIEIIGTASSGRETIDLVMEREPDLALLEISLAEVDGIQAMGQIKLERPDIRVLMFSNYNNPRHIARAVALGAEGYLLKSCSRDELAESITSAAKGEQIWTRSELRRVGAAMATPAGAITLDVALTQREMQVLESIVNGSTNRDIGDDLDISYETVKEHVQHVLRKIGITDRTQAAIWAVREKLY